MKIKSAKSGGGIGMSITKSGKASWKQEPKTKAISVEATAQLGAATAFKKPPLFSGPGYSTKSMPSTGSRSYYNSATSGSGSQRTIYPKGTQSQTQTREIRKGVDILKSFGPEISGPSRRK